MGARSNGRPEAGLLDWLRRQGIDFEVHEHPEAFTAEHTARVEGIDARTFAKVVGVVTDDGRPAVIVVDAPDRVDLDKAREVLGATWVRLLTEAELNELAPKYAAGAMPAVGSLCGLPMYADFGVQDDPEISFNAGTHRYSVRVDRAAWERAAQVHYADLAVQTEARPAWAR